MKVKLYEHQKKAVEELGNGKILRADPGVGKTMTALAYFYTKECGGTLNDWGSLKTPKDVYIITTAKKRNEGDWQRDAFYLGLMEDPELSVSGIKVTVDSWNNIEKYKEVRDAFFIFDEQKVVGSGPWAKSFIAIAKANRWILLSATPGDTWLDYAPVFLANGFYKNITEFKHTHVVYSPWHKFPKVERYNGLGRLVRNRNAVLVEMPYDRHTTRHLTWVEVDHDRELLERVTKQRWHVYENRPLRDITELFSVARKVVNSSESRLEKVRSLQSKHKRLIVFYNFDYELELLRTLASGSSVVAGTNGKRDSTTSRTLVPPSPESTESSKNFQTTLTSLPGSDEWLTTYSKAGRSSTSLDVADRTSGSSTRTAPQPAGDRSSWDYLLSPEGMRANAQRQAGDTPRHLYDRPSDPEKILLSGQFESIRKLTSGRGVLKVSPNTFEITSSITPSGVTSSVTATGRSGRTTSPSTESRQTVGSSPTHSVPTIDSGRRRTVFEEIPSIGLEAMPSEKDSVAAQPTHRPSLSNLPDSTTTTRQESGRSKRSGGGSFAVAEWNGHKHEPVPTTDEWIYLVQYRAGAEAWNCTTTDTVVFWSPTYSYKDFEQSQGRIDRLNTPFDDLWYWALYSDSWIDKAVKGSLDVKQDFNEKRFEKKLEADLYAEELVERMAA